MSLTVMGGSVSPFVRKVRAFLAEKNLDYEQQNINPFSPPDGWRERSPLGKIPALEHDGRMVNDSSVICAYLERIEPNPALYPADPYVEISPADARRLGVAPNDWVTLRSRRGHARARAFPTHAVAPAQLFLPMHGSATNRLTASVFDPHSRQPSYKYCAVSLVPEER